MHERSVTHKNFRCNGEKYLQQQLDSFVQQTRQPYELVVTDDCSTDATVGLLEAFAQVAPFDVIFHRNERNYGYCGNFNQALIRTSGDLVFMSDQDDVWFPEKIEHMVQAAVDNPADLVLMNDALLTDHRLCAANVTKLGQLRRLGRIETDFFMGCCVVVRRKFLDLVLPIPSAVSAHDGYLVRLAAGMQRRFIDKTVLRYYRRHDENTSLQVANEITWLRVILRLAGDLPTLLSTLWKRGAGGDQRSSGVHKCIRRQLIISERKIYCSVEPEWREDLTAFITSMTRKLSEIEYEEYVRQRAFPARVVYVIRGIFAGRYFSKPWWKALRDLF